MNQGQQKVKTFRNKLYGERVLKAALLPWFIDIIKNYRIGNQYINNEEKRDLQKILLRTYPKISEKVLNFDVREVKSDSIDEQMKRSISMQVSKIYVDRVSVVVDSIFNTAVNWIKKVSAYAVAEDLTQREATVMASNYLKNQLLTVATVESQFIVEATRRTIVKTINDPLKNTVQQIVNLIESGNYNEATKLSRSVSKLSKLDVSKNQGKIISIVKDNREKLVTPITQGEAVANLRRAAKTYSGETKKWQTMGDSRVRSSHIDANGQEKPVDEPFIVGGFPMQYPGDSSLGAPLNQIIGCRCLSVYI